MRARLARSAVRAAGAAGWNSEASADECGREARHCLRSAPYALRPLSRINRSNRSQRSLRR